MTTKISKSFITSFLTMSPDAILFTDEEGAIIFANKKTENIFGYSPKEMLGKSVIDIFSSEYRTKHRSRIETLIKSDVAVGTWQTIEKKGLNKNNQRVHIEVSFNALKEGSKYIIVYIIRDISRKSELQEKLYRQSITDHLTGLYNRRYFEKIFKTEFERANRYRRPLSIMVIDIDGFKQANDLYGHTFGDTILAKIKSALKDNARKLDRLFRYGGDEFVMILPETPKEGAIDVASRVMNRFIQKCNVKDKRIKLTLSIGLSSFPEDGKDENALIGQADKRMYSSKDKGGNTVTAYTITELVGNKADKLLNSLVAFIIMMEESRAMLSLGGISHSQRVRALAIEIGRRLSLSPKRMTMLELASVFHDIGLFFISKDIMHKADAFTEKEVSEMRKHPLIGEEIIEVALANNRTLMDIARIVGQHHEWLNGDGYPRGLKGKNIMIESQILSVIDTYEAMTSERPYRSSYKKNAVIKELRHHSGERYNPKIVNILFEIEGLK